MTRAGLLLVLAAGCGPEGGVWLRVGAPFHAPDQCDGLHVQAWRGDSAGPLLHDDVRALGASQFPATLALLTSNGADFAGTPVAVTVSALLLGNPIPCASASQEVILQKGSLVPVDFELKTCAAP